MTIERFDGEFAFLSNFSPSPLFYDGVVYPTVEHAFQAAKTHDPAVRREISKLLTPSLAKKMGRGVRLRPDWEEVKEKVMLECLLFKFGAPRLALALIKTAPHTLVEGNSWGDTYWGVCQGEGKNRLGALLMVVRDQLIQIVSIAR